MSIKQQVKLIKEGKISVSDYVKEVLKQSTKINDELKCLNYFARDEAIKRAEILDRELKQNKTNGKLFGIPITAKDDLCVKGMETTSGSTILRGYKPPYNATCIEKVLMEKGIIIG